MFPGTVNVSYHIFGPLATPSKNATGTSSPPGKTPPPLILIHGFGGTKYFWPLDVLQGLAQHRKVVIFDNPRIGMSTDSSKDPLTVEHMANVTLGFIKALKLKKPDILGYSLGGEVALTMVTQSGKDLGSVICLSGSYGGPDAPVPPKGLKPALDIATKMYIDSFLPEKNPLAKSAGINETALAEDKNTLMYPLGGLDPGRQINPAALTLMTFYKKKLEVYIICFKFILCVCFWQRCPARAFFFDTELKAGIH